MNKAEREAMLQDKLQKMKEFEEALYENGAACIAGVDEVGRGPLAGPVVAAAVILPRDFDIIGIDDSKKLSEKKREAFYPVIKERAIAWGVGMEDHETIDQINILQATKQAMISAVEQASEMLLRKMGRSIDHILLDALTIDKIAIPQTGIVKGDCKSISIACASVLAKVTRDHMMREFDAIYPGYAFAKNKGYGTMAHYEGLHKKGLCPIHRKTFLKNFTE